MAILKLNNTTVLTETNGVASIPSTVKFPAGHIIEVKTISHTSSTGDTFGIAFGTALTMNNILTTEKIIINCGGGWAKFGNASYRRNTHTMVQVDYDGTTALIKGGYAAAETGATDNRGAPGFVTGVWENNTGSTINTLTLKSYGKGTSAYANWNASSDYPITIVAMRCVNA